MTQSDLFGLKSATLEPRVAGFTGHRPDKLGGYGPSPVQDRARRAIREFLEAYRPHLGISGMALGVDQWAAEACIELDIPFVAAVPFEGQDRKWPEESRDRYRDLLERCALVVVVSPGGFSRAKMQRRNKWVVDFCTRLFAVWDGTSGGTANCVRYAAKVGRELVRFDPSRAGAVAWGPG